MANTTAVIRCVSGSVFQRARAALIYLSLGMHQEERKRLKETKGGDAPGRSGGPLETVGAAARMALKSVTAIYKIYRDRPQCSVFSVLADPTEDYAGLISYLTQGVHSRNVTYVSGRTIQQNNKFKNPR